MKTLSFKASDNFMDKYDKILSLEEQEEYSFEQIGDI